jgi:ABC-type transport system involved in multi-copper enzyme maturation permease subunit
MDIRSKGYSPWPGPLRRDGLAWAPIFRHGIRQVFRRRFSKLLFAMAAAPFFVFLVGIYVRSKPELKMLSRLVRQLQSDASLFHSFYTNGFLVFWLMILSIFCGAGLISGDLKFHALALYFARPLRRRDYLAGKFAVILFYLLLFTLLPGLLLLVLNALFQGAWTASPGLLAGALLYPLLTGFFLAALTLGLSIVSPNTKLVQVIIFFIFIFSNTLAEILHQVFRSYWCYLVSFQRNFEQLGTLLFGLPARFAAPAWLSAVTLAGLGLLALAALNRRVRKAEAQS